MSKNLKLNCQGVALVTTLVFLALLLLLGGAAWILTHAEINFSAKDSYRVQAFYLAEAGTEELRGRLKGTSNSTNHIEDPSSNPDPLWSAYIITSDSWQYSDDPNYNSNYRNYFPTTGSNPDLDNTSETLNSLQADMRYWAKIRHKREYDAERAGHTVGNPLYYDGDGDTSGGHTANDPGSIIYYGYRNSSSTTLEEFTSTGSNPETGKPVVVIYSNGTSRDISKTIQVEVASSVSPPILGSLYCSSASGNGDVSIDGNDSCSGNSVPSIAYIDGESLSGGSVTLDPSPQQVTDNVDISGYIDSMKSQATITLTSDQNGLTGGSADNYEIVYCDANLLSPDQELDFNNLTGYGMLLVDGDVRFQGDLAWHGIIVVSGNADFYGGGGGDRNVYGAVLAGSVAALYGSMSIQYSSCEVDNANSSGNYRISRWEQL